MHELGEHLLKGGGRACMRMGMLLLLTADLYHHVADRRRLRRRRPARHHGRHHLHPARPAHRPLACSASRAARGGARRSGWVVVLEFCGVAGSILGWRAHDPATSSAGQRLDRKLQPACDLTTVYRRVHSCPMADLPAADLNGRARTDRPTPVPKHGGGHGPLHGGAQSRTCSRWPDASQRARGVENTLTPPGSNSRYSAPRSADSVPRLGPARDESRLRPPAPMAAGRAAGPCNPPLPAAARAERIGRMLETATWSELVSSSAQSTPARRRASPCVCHGQ